jgi:hypothetical protein
VNPRAVAWEHRLATPMPIAALLVVPAIVLQAGDYGSGWSTIGQLLNWGRGACSPGRL